MSRATRYLRNLAIATAFWVILLLNIAQFPLEYHLFIKALPVIAVLLFGVFAASDILYHLAVFKECPEAYQELQKQIAEAKFDLKKKGLKVN